MCRINYCSVCFHSVQTTCMQRSPKLNKTILQQMRPCFSNVLEQHFSTFWTPPCSLKAQHMLRNCWIQWGLVWTQVLSWTKAYILARLLQTLKILAEGKCYAADRTYCKCYCRLTHLCWKLLATVVKCSCCRGVSRRRGLCGVAIRFCSSQLFLNVKPCVPMEREISSDVSRSDRELGALHLCRPEQTSSLS